MTEIVILLTIRNLTPKDLPSYAWSGSATERGDGRCAAHRFDAVNQNGPSLSAEYRDGVGGLGERYIQVGVCPESAGMPAIPRRARGETHLALALLLCQRRHSDATASTPSGGCHAVSTPPSRTRGRAGGCRAHQYLRRRSNRTRGRGATRLTRTGRSVRCIARGRSNPAAKARPAMQDTLPRPGTEEAPSGRGAGHRRSPRPCPYRVRRRLPPPERAGSAGQRRPATRVVARYRRPADGRPSGLHRLDHPIVVVRRIECGLI
jgi:hypothetical protein